MSTEIEKHYTDQEFCEIMETINRKIAAYQRRVERATEEKRVKAETRARLEAERKAENEEMRVMAGRVMQEFAGGFGFEAPP